MRTLLAIVICVGGILPLTATADTARKRAKPRNDAAQARYYPKYPRFSREEVECMRARHEDPTGDFAGYPCWAGAAFGSGRNGSPGHR